MKRNEYQNAFSKIEPSQALLEAALSPKKPQSVRQGTHLGTILLAAVFTVALLVGTAFAAVHFQWFSLGGAEHIVEPTYDAEAIGKQDLLLPDPQKLLSLEGEPSDSYIGFMLPESYLDGQDALNCRMIKNGLYQRYYRNPARGNPDSPLLTVEIIYDADFLTRYPSEIVKEDVLNGMQTVWLKVESSADDRPQYCIFQHNEELGCFAMIASTTSFEEAEKAAKDLRYLDSGIPIAQTEDALYYGFRLGWQPENMALDSRTVMADRWYLANATLRDESLDLNSILLGSNWVSTGDTMCNIGIWIIEGLSYPAPVENGTVYKTGMICGHEARWVQGYGGQSVIIQISFPEEQVQLCAQISCYVKNPETGEIEEIAAEEACVEIAERMLETAELVQVFIAEPAPTDFRPFAVG
ncbi:MAG: hypothetical protein IJG45_01240 [Oscillospiraceae bacterium]|nr:hypothetical protein [Oscillospiraceae bacterium]